MRARDIVVLLLVAWATPVHADEEIEMEPETPAKPPEPPPPTEAPPAEPTPVEPAPAEPAPVVKDPKLAKKLVAAGAQQVAKGDYLARAKRPDDAKSHYEQAANAFRKALEVGDDLNVHFDLANVEDKLGRHVEAARHWRVLVKAQGGVKPDVLKKATAKLDAALTKLAVITLAVQPEGATISLAGVELGKAPLAEPVLVVPGNYVFQFTADGFQPKEVEITVEAGSETERGIELAPVPVIIEKIRPSDIDEPVVPVVVKQPDRTPLVIGAGATAVFALTATVTGILAVGKHGTFTAGDSSAGERDDAQSAGKRFALIADIAIGGALVAGGFTAYWYLFKYKPARDSAKVTALPWVQSDTGGVAVSGRF